MIVFMSSTIGLTEAERLELSHRAASRSGRADDGRRARLILLLAAGHSWAQIRDKLSCNDAFIARWSKRFGGSDWRGCSVAMLGKARAN